MKTDGMLCDRPLPGRLRRYLETLLDADEAVRAALVGDLLLTGTYADTALVLTDRRLVCVEDQMLIDAEEDRSDGGVSLSCDIPYTQIREVRAERMYGNAVLRVNDEIVFRCTFAVLALCEAVAAYLNALHDGGDPQEQLSILAATIEKEHAFCPKCGRALIRPGAPCVNCMSKGKLVKKLWTYVAPYKWMMLFCMALSCLATAMALVPPYITKMLVDTVIPLKDRHLLFLLVGVLLGVYVVQNVTNALRGYLMRVAGAKVVTDLRDDVYRKAQYLPVKFYDKTSTGSMFSRISGDTNTLNAFMQRITQEAVVQVFLLIGIMVIMFVMNWKLTLLSLIPVPLVVLGSRYFGQRIRPIYRRTWMSWSAVSSILSDTLPGVRVIKSFTGEGRAIKKFSRYLNNWCRQDNHAAAPAAVFPSAVTFFVTCGSLLIWGVGGQWVMDAPETLSLGLLVSFISYTSMFYGPVNFFANLSDSYQQALTSAERLLDILDAEPEHDLGRGNKIEVMHGRIEFKHVSFSFDKASKTLDDIDLTIEPGDIVGIVGTTGSGKSTLINLLMRFYDDYDGEILVDGQDIRQIDLQSYREKIGFVQQEPLMFRDTVFKNIAFSDPDASVEEVIHAADIANAHEFILKLPDAYDTVLGERGSGLSGGERQRLSIARAVIKNPSVLIFDEATAAVDSETEHLIQEAIERLISGRTTLMIAHRLSTLRKANKIVVVDKGRIIECGSHEELMAKKGKFYRLIQIQNMSEEAQRQSSEEHFG